MKSKISWRYILPVLILLVLLIATLIGFLRLRSAFDNPIPVAPAPEKTGTSQKIKPPLPPQKSQPTPPLPRQTPPPLSALPTPPIPPQKLPEGDIRLNPEYRKNTLKELEVQRVAQIKQFHQAFFEELGLNDEQATEFAKFLTINELWFFERSIFPGEDGSFPVPPNFKEVAQKRQEMLESDSQKFGKEAAEKFRRTYPGPGDSSHNVDIP